MGMLLYHGTTESAAKKILAGEGIRPRCLTKASNWDHSVKSNPKMVYMTNTYGAYFAAMAEHKGERWAILEIDTDALDEARMYPDEDALVACGTGDTGYVRVRKFRDNLHKYADFWRESLGILGTCSYLGTIPAYAITRVAYFEPHSNPVIYINASDASVSRLAYQICGHRHRVMQDWLFAEPITAQVLGDIPDYAVGQVPWLDERLKVYERAITQTEGREVVVL
jgi:hypothetical protein